MPFLAYLRVPMSPHAPDPQQLGRHDYASHHPLYKGFDAPPSLW